MDCEYSKRCWRYSYSRYLLDKGYSVPPKRIDLFCEEYATVEMMPNAGLFAQNMPFLNNGQAHNLCPIFQQLSNRSCAEYQKEAKRIDDLVKARENAKTARRIFTNANGRVWIAPEVRQEIARQYHYTCVYCHRHQNQIWNGKKIQGCIDHFYPLAQGGDASSTENLVFACVECNQAKGANVWKLGCRVGYYHEC